MAQVLDIEQSLLLLELEPPFEKRDVQLARRRLAKIWHPDIAPPGKQFEHEHHLKAINEAADQLESLAEGARGGRRREPAPTRRLSARPLPTRTVGSTIRSPARSPTTRSCTATRAASR